MGRPVRKRRPENPLAAKKTKKNGHLQKSERVRGKPNTNQFARKSIQNQYKSLADKEEMNYYLRNKSVGKIWSTT